MNGAIVVAGGSGTRFGSAGGKQLALLAGAPVIEWTVRAVEAASTIGCAVLVGAPEALLAFEQVVRDVGSDKVLAVVAGGETRGDSVRAGLEALPAECAIVVVHDGARPLAGAEHIDAVVRALDADHGLDGAILAHPVVDTVKVVSDEIVVDTPDRSAMWAADTPQAFRSEALREAHTRAVADGFEGTDDASLLERVGRRVKVVAGPRWNIKVTVPEDLDLAEALLDRGREESA